MFIENRLFSFSSQNTLRRTRDEAFTDDDDEWIFDPALDPVMVGGGAGTNPLLEFDLQPIGARRNWRNAVDKQRYEATLRQQRDSTPTDNIGQELTHALRRSIQRQIDADNTLSPHSTIHFSMQSSAFTHAFQSTTFTVSEEFAPDDTFSMETTFIRTPEPGSGNGKRYKPSCAAARGIMKKSRITIKNKDNLCCVRAIVTMKALADANGNTRDPEYHNLKQGCPVQERKAKELHQLAGVPEGPCAIPELTRFQAALPNHQIKVMSIDPPHMIIFAGNPATPNGKIIRLIKEDGHYDGCNYFAGFLSKSYFCDDCNRGYDHEDFRHHPCTGKRCISCKRKGCPDFLDAKRLLQPGQFPTPTSVCPLCHRKFFGDQCYNYHLQHRSLRLKSICDSLKKCPTVVTCTNWTTKFVLAVTVAPRFTSADGENVTSAKRMCTWPRTNATFNGYLKVMTIPN